MHVASVTGLGLNSTRSFAFLAFFAFWAAEKMLNRHRPIIALPPIRPQRDSGTRASSCMSSATAGKGRAARARTLLAENVRLKPGNAGDDSFKGPPSRPPPSAASPCSLSLTRAVYLCLQPPSTPSHSLNQTLTQVAPVACAFTLTFKSPLPTLHSLPTLVHRACRPSSSLASTTLFENSTCFSSNLTDCVCENQASLLLHP